MLYDILKDFNGSQDGRFTETFLAGSQAELSDHLVAALGSGFVRPAGQDDPATIDNKAVVSDGSHFGRRAARGR